MNYNLPQKGKKLFGATENWEFNARLNWGDARFNFYIFGYKEAADALVEHIVNRKSKQDFLIYPIAFLYRHYIELQLKKIINTIRKIKGKKGGFPKNHKLSGLWKECRPLVEDVWPGASREPLNNLEDYLEQFEEVDPFSYGFRYTTDKKNNETLSKLKQINIINFKERVDEISRLLNGISLEFTEILRQQQEEMETKEG